MILRIAILIINLALARRVAAPGRSLKGWPLALTSQWSEPAATIPSQDLKLANYLNHSQQLPAGTNRLGRKRGRPFAKGHRGQWPRPADADTRLVLCPKCNQHKPLSSFLDRANKQAKECQPCHWQVLSARSRGHIERIKADPSAIIAALNRLDDLQAAEATMIPGGPGNVHLWYAHQCKWKRERSKLRSTYGLQPKRGVRGHFEYQARYGIIPADTVEDRIREYYERHPGERPTDGPDSQQPVPATE